MSHRVFARRHPLALGVSAGLAGMLALAPTSAAWANDECGPAVDGGTITCEATVDPYTGVRYEGVNDLEVVLKEGAIVDGGPVLIEGDGAISLYAENGAVIRDTAATPAVDVLSLSGPVSVRVDEVYGGGYGVVAVSYGDVAVQANYVEANNGIRAQALGAGNAVVDAGVVWAQYGTGIFAFTDTGTVNVNADVVFAEGESAIGIDTLAVGGSIAVNAGYVEAIGDGSTGIKADTQNGMIEINVDTVGASGFGSVGVLASASESGDVLINAGTARAEGDYSWGIYAESLFGSVDINAGYASASGFGSIGLVGLSYDGGNVNLNAGTVAAFGDYSIGVLASAGFGDVAVNADYIYAFGSEGGAALGVYAFNGNAQVNVGSVGTEGNWAYGMDIGAAGDVSVTANEALTFGEAATAINIATGGGVSVEVDRLVTYGFGANGLVAYGGGLMDLDIGIVDTWGDWSQGIVAVGDTVNARVGTVVTHGGGEAYAVELGATGDGTLTVTDGVVSNSGRAIALTSLFGSAAVTVEAGAYVFGRDNAISTSSLLGSSINIAGTVESIDGPAIAAFGDVFGQDPTSGAATIQIAATGAVLGTLQLAGGDDVVTNAGRFLTAGQSDFGGGNDRLANSGVLGLRDASATSISLLGLERLENSGLITLANGRTGDSLFVSGTLEGKAGGQLAVDVNLGTGASDLIQVGDLAGTNALRLNFVGSGSGLGLNGIRVLNSGASETGDELVLAASSQNRGFVGFSLAYDGFDGWDLESDLTDAAYLAGVMPAGVRGLWRTGVDAVSNHLVQTRAEGEQSGVWVQAIGGDFEGETGLSHAQGSRDLAWEGSHSGLQMGAETSVGGWQLGFTGGQSKARMDLGGWENTRFDSVNAGLYASYSDNGWYAGAMLRGDRVDVETNWASIGLSDDGDATMLGLNLEGGRRFTFNKVWIEPAMRLAWVNVSLPEQDGQYGDIRWDDGSAVTGELGLRMGATEGLFGLPLRPYVAMSIAREFGADDQTIYKLGSEAVRVASDGDLTYGRLTGGLSYTRGRFDLYTEVDARFGDLEGTSGRLGARVRF